MLATTKMRVDTATASDESVDDRLPWHIPREPGSTYIGNVRAAQHRVAHTVAAEPLFRRAGEPVDILGVHITVTLRTDIFDTGRNGAAHEPTTEYVYDPLLRGIVNMAVARFVSERPPRMPSLTDATKLFSAAVE